MSIISQKWKKKQINLLKKKQKKFKKSHCRIQHPLKTELNQIKSDTLDSLKTLREA